MIAVSVEARMQSEDAKRAFNKEYAGMRNYLRQWDDAPLILIGKAALVLLDMEKPVTLDAIREMVIGLDDPDNASLVARTMTYLDQLSAVFT